MLGPAAAVGKAYTVPAGRNVLLTDLTISNFTVAKKFFIVLSGAGGSCAEAGLMSRVDHFLVPPENSAVLAFQTGIGFGADQAVCIYSSVHL